MNTSQIIAIYKTILSHIALGRLKKAFDQTSLLIDELQIGNYADRYNELRQNYQYLLDYYIKGIEDPERKTVYNKLISRIFTLNNDLCEELLFRNSSSIEYTQQRYFPHSRKYKTSTELLISLKYYHSQSMILKDMENNHEVEMRRLRSNYEFACAELFTLFWLIFNIGNEEKNVFTTIMSSEYGGEREKTLLVSALTMNLWRRFDETKLMLLFDCSDSESPQVKQRALTGLCFILARYNRFLQYFPAIRNRLMIMADNNHTQENFNNIIIQIISTVETDKISKKLRDEILPEIMKISPKLKDKMDAENLLKSDEWGEENPEWQEILENSGISDKLQELNELQMEGADVYMSTFSMLKSFPFFNEISNWFLPFDIQTLEISSLFEKDEKSILAAFVGNNIMCNSDKYSFCLSILQMPEGQRNMLKQSFKTESEQLEEMAKDEAMLMPDISAKNISKQYVQDLFRFFKLHPNKNDFSDMFDLALMLHKTYLFDILTSNSSLKARIAEYYFAKSHYKEAIDLYKNLVIESQPTAALYQKMGYSYQQLSQINMAIDAYEKADIIQPDDLWTIRKIALCYRLSGDYAKALEYYQHVDFLKPDQQSVLLQIGKCMVEIGRFKEALNIYFKLDAAEEGNIKVWRAIVWCAFVSGNLKKATYYSEKVLNDQPVAQDFLNAAHVAWCKKDIDEACDLYRKSINILNNDIDTFTDLFDKDRNYLKNNGITDDELSLMIDELSFLTRN
ncbi:MAG: hypothetical protein PHH37_15250 [Paludibacter sp.]|nr:hypothetical protein [Paludibacter sp.]